jgi:hypothetical protein
MKPWIKYGPLYISAACIIAGYAVFRPGSAPRPMWRGEIRAEDLAELRAGLLERQIAYLVGSATYSNANTFGWGAVTNNAIGQTFTSATNTPPEWARIAAVPTLAAARAQTLAPIRDLFCRQSGDIFWLMDDLADGQAILTNDFKWVMRESDTNKMDVGTGNIFPLIRLTSDTAAFNPSNVYSEADITTNFAAFDVLFMGAPSQNSLGATNQWPDAIAPRQTRWAMLHATNDWTLGCETLSNRSLYAWNIYRRISTNDLIQCFAALTNMTRAVCFDMSEDYCVSTTCIEHRVSAVFKTGSQNPPPSYNALIGSALRGNGDSTSYDNGYPSSPAYLAYYSMDAHISWSSSGFGWGRAETDLTVSKCQYQLQWPCSMAYASGLVKRIRVFAILGYSYYPSLDFIGEKNIAGNTPNLRNFGGVALALSCQPEYSGDSTSEKEFMSIAGDLDSMASARLALVCDSDMPSAAPSFWIDLLEYQPDPEIYSSCESSIFSGWSDAGCIVSIAPFGFLIVADFNFKHCAATPFQPDLFTPEWAITNGVTQ